ncbi:MAG: hypothetical protein CML06_03050 [Pseudomonadales bacterium]|nr:hypothetical protein [Pseudomonadales bacterium]
MSSKLYRAAVITAVASWCFVPPLHATVATNDLLSPELWALSNSPTTQAAGTSGSGTGEISGTCAVRPEINGDEYTCDSYIAPGTEDMDINAVEGWQAFLPAANLLQDQVVIALIDTGIDYRHPDLRNKVWLNPGEVTGQDSNGNGVDDGCEDQVDGDNNGYLNDCHGINTLVPRQHPDGSLNAAAGDPLDNAAGHGTNMAGVMAAEGNNASATYHGGTVGVAGLAANIRIATCASANIETDVFPLIPGVGVPAARESAIRQCLWYFYNLKQAGVNIAVINASGGMSKHINLFGFMYPLVADDYLLNTPEMFLLADLLEAADIPVVAAAGNNSWSIDQTIEERAYFPAAFENNNIIAVAANNNQGELWSGSSYGRWSVDVLAPGESILSTVPGYPIFPQESADFVVTDGTSQATAYVSGIVAMLKANQGTQHLDAFSVKRLLMSSGKKLSAGVDKTASAALVRLADSNGKGALTCQNQWFSRRQKPKADRMIALPGETVIVEFQSFNCANPAGTPPISVQVSPGGTSFTLVDNGTGVDTIANDGIYSGSWTVPHGAFEYTLSGGFDTVTETTDQLQIQAAIVEDNTDNTDWVGSWWASIYRPGFYGYNYRYATVNDPEKRFTWSPSVNDAGYYRVYARWPAGPNFATNATYRIHHQDPVNATALTQEVQVDQTSQGDTWIDLGVYWFDNGTQAIELTNLFANGTVVADAVQLVPEP